jgi:indolepyruvate ferredoxin oxidoreductase beta subunit
MIKNFNIIIKGVGGQGIVTLVAIIDQAAFLDGYDIRSSELHGLSQREGSVEAHVKFGKKVYSPLVYKGQVDLIIGQELLEGLRSVALGGAQTKFLINTFFSPFIGSIKEQEALDELAKLPKDKLILVPASKVCQERLGKEVVSSIYLLGYAVKNNLIPLKAESVLKAIEKVIPQKYLELNKKAFNLA